MVFRSGAGVAELQQNKFRRQNPPVPTGRGQRVRMGRVVIPEQRQIEKRVRENHAYAFFGSPLT